MKVQHVRILAFCSLLLLAVGCYAPLRSPGISATTLPAEFRAPQRSQAYSVNYGMLARPTVEEYVVGPKDLVGVQIENLWPSLVRLPTDDGRPTTIKNPPNSFHGELEISASGDVLLPLVGSVDIAGMTLKNARRKIIDAFSDDVLDDPQVSINLIQKSTKNVMVIGEVEQPGVYQLENLQNDVAHALSMAGGLSADAADEIQVHRARQGNIDGPEFEHHCWAIPSQANCGSSVIDTPSFVRIPLRMSVPPPDLLTPDLVTLNEGDVVVVPKRTDEVFYVVGKLNTDNVARFSVGRDNRDLGNGFVLPPDRDVDVVTAVAMAGYIDPIDSPTTVTVHRANPGGAPLLIHVDLIAARYDERENIMVVAGDIIYLNPDAPWWFRRTLDRIVPELLTFPYQRAILKAFGQARQ